MKKITHFLLMVLIVLSLTSCSTPREKAINYVKANGTSSENEVYVAFQDYFLEKYNTYFIVYNNESDTFTFEYYSSNKYFDTPPTSNYDIYNSVTIDLSTGNAKYYSDNEYTGTAKIDIESYSKTNNKLSDVVICGEYEQVFGTVEVTFEQTAFNTVDYIDLLLSKSNAKVTVVDFGFTAFAEKG